MSLLRSLRAFAVMTCLIVACGGRTSMVEEALSADAASPADVAATVDAASTVDAAEPVDTAGCVLVDPSSYDASCNVDLDCVTVGGGALCADACIVCRGQYLRRDYGNFTFTISAAALAKYNADTAVLKGACPVVADTMCTGFAAMCQKHRCVAGQGG